jgi:hypothetical protein
VTDPVLMLGLVWAAYLAARLGVEAVIELGLVQASRPARGNSNPAHANHPQAEKWSPAPAALWLVREAVVAVAVTGVAWLVLRDLSLPNLVPSVVSAGPGDVRRVGIAAVLGWSLAVINLPAAWQFIGQLLPAEDEKPDKRIDPRMMGATIGVLERVLVIALVPGGGPAAVGFVVAAKTLARFRELNNKRFAERYLLGTMASVTIALVSALAVGWIWSAPL